MKNIGWMLRQRATVSPRLQAYVEPSTDVRMTYAQMNALANRCADVLTALGIAKGDRVALLMPNSVEFCCLFYGAAKLGAVAVPINTRLAAPEVSFILSDSGSKVVIYGAPSAPVIDAIRAQADPPGTVTDWIGADSLAERLRSAAADEPAVECGGDDNLFSCTPRAPPDIPREWCIPTNRCIRRPVPGPRRSTCATATACCYRCRCSTWRR